MQSATLGKGLEHLQILVSEGVLEPIPHRYRGMTTLIMMIRRAGSRENMCMLMWKQKEREYNVKSFFTPQIE